MTALSTRAASETPSDRPNFREALIKSLARGTAPSASVSPQSLPALGAGIAFRPPFLSDLFLDRAAADFLEITADHYFDATPEKEAELELLAGAFTLIPHGLNLSLGSAEGLDPRYLEKFARLVERLDPPWCSEHIAFTRAGGVEIGHLAPLPFTREAIDALARNVAEVRRHIAAPLILENITCTVTLPGAEMTEAQFVSEAIRATGCGLLLDVTNLFTNCANRGRDPLDALDALPLDRVVQLHFVGGHTSGGEWIDSHSQPTPAPVWALLDEVLRRAPVRGVILERDENLPPFAELAAEVLRARDIGKTHRRWT